MCCVCTVCKMHSVSCLTVRAVFIALFYFVLLRQVLAADVQHGAGIQRRSQRSRYTRSANTDTESHRLPADLRPLHYDLVIHPDIYQDNPSEFRFEGRVTIKMKCIVPTKAIVLNARDLIIAQSDIVVSGRAGNLNVVSVVLNDQVETLNITLEEELTEGENYTVRIDFSGPLKDDLRGLYFSTYTRGNQTVYLATTQFQPADARKAFPCMDEPALKAAFTIHVIRRSFNRALSNMPVKTSTNLDGGKVEDEFETSVPMSTYLVAFVVCEFARKTMMTNTNVQVEVWSRREAVDQLDFALDFGVKTVDFLEEYFRVRYPLPKLSMVGIPDFALGAMENWGLVTYREEYLLFNDETNSVIGKMTTAKYVAHEVSHMWFGNLVTPVWWDDLWLNEGFASFMQTMVPDHFHPDRKIIDTFVTDMHEAMITDGLVSSHPLYVPVATPSQIGEIFDSISYLKGALVVQMIHFVIGDDRFRQGMQKYLSTLKYGNAQHTDLWRALESDELDVSITDVMNTWTQQMNYPVVTVTFEGQTVTLRQERFLQDHSAEDPGTYTSPFGYKWYIPFTFSSSDERNFNITVSDIIWITKDEDTKTFTVPTLSEDSWVLGNIGLKGYYRVNYDDDNWRKLTAQLRNDHTAIDPVNRAQIISDAWNLASAGLVNTTRALEAVDYLDKETEFMPWSEASFELTKVSNMLSTTDTFPAFKAFMVEKTSPLYLRLGMTTTDDYLETKLRTHIASTACQYGGPECINDASNYLLEWKQNPDVNPIPKAMHYIVYCARLRQGNTDDWNFVYGRFLEERDPGERGDLLASLCCTSNTNDLDRLLDRTLNSGDIRTQDFFDVLFYTILNPVGANRAWTFINNTWDSHQEKYAAASVALPYAIKVFGDVFSTEDQLLKMQDFVNKHNDLGAATQAFSAALESITNNIAWMKKNAGIVRTWLQERGFSA